MDLVVFDSWDLELEAAGNMESQLYGFDLGYVELQEGVRIWTRLLGAEAGTFKVGQEVDLHIDVMQEDAEGNEILGYCFVPVRK